MSIKTRALLVSVTINQPKKSKMDKSAAQKAAADANASASAVRVSHDLYPKHLIQPIEQVAARARALCSSQRYTYPWGRNQDLLPSERAMDFMTEAGKIELEFEQAVTAFMNNYVNVIQDAQSELGTMFDPLCYPDVSELRQQFRLKFYYDQITDSRDWRVQVSEEAGEELAQRREADLREKYAGLAQAPLDNLKDQIAHLHTVLTAPPREITDSDGYVTKIKHATFKNSSVDKIIDECQKIIDFGEDVLMPETVALARCIKSELPSGDHIRKSETTRVKAITLCKQWMEDIEEDTQPETQPNPMGLTEDISERVDTLECPPEEVTVSFDDDVDFDDDGFQPLEPNPSAHLMTDDIDDLFKEDF